MKKKKLIIIFLVILLISLSIFIGIKILNDKQRLSVNEKQWLNANKNNVISVNVINDLNVFGKDGKGLFYDFLNSLSENYNIEINPVTFNSQNKATGAFLGYSLTEKNFQSFFDDEFVVVNKSEKIIKSLDDIKNYKIGITEEFKNYIEKYLSDESNEYVLYKTKEELIKAYKENNELNFIIVPKIMYLDEILTSKDYQINYYFTEMSKKIVLTLSNDNKELNNIVKKYYEKWKKEYFVSEYNEEYLKYYVSAKNMNAKTKADMLSKNYVYGYAENAPYEVNVDGTPSGIASEYIARLKRLTGIDITYKKYKNVESLQQAINNKEVDIYFNYFDASLTGYTNTVSPFVEEYVILRNNKNKENVTTFEELKEKNINVLSNTALGKYLKANSKANIIEKNKLEELTKDDNLLVIDKEVYLYYRNTKFSKYEPIYTATMSNDYTFSILSSDSDLYNLFNFIITTNSYYNYRISGLNSLNLSLVDRTSFEELYLIVLGIILLPLLILLALYLILKNRKKQKKVRKEDRRNYTDILTSLKNRNYLNLNMPIWENSKIYPQTIIMIDLNNIKYVNDNYGHEAGDNLIVAAASNLVNNQLENSEIIRTDGNEFLIYLVGYTEKQIETYCKKLNKELKDLPYGFGAAIGYSMIMDDIKTIDDAINEATLEMKTVKEELK